MPAMSPSLSDFLLGKSASSSEIHYFSSLWYSHTMVEQAQFFLPPELTFPPDGATYRNLRPEDQNGAQ